MGPGCGWGKNRARQQLTTQGNDAFWSAVWFLVDFFRVDGEFAMYGYWLFRFWEQ
jgi:hypothetical protein